MDRISNLGIQSSIPGQEVVRGQVGPFARSAADLSLLLSAISPARCAAQDPRVAPLPLFRDAVEPGRLRVGYFCDDGIVSPSVAVRRATETAKRLLEAAGCTLVPLDPPLTEELVFTYLAALSADGGKTVFDGLAPADVDPALALLATWVRLPAPLRRIGRVGVDYAGERLLARMLAVLGEKSVASLFALTQRARQIQHAVFEAWNQQELDAVICPPHATPALKHGQSRDFTLGGALSIRYNFVNFPAGVAPITRVAAAEGTRPHPRRRLDKQAAEVDQDSAGLPVGVQVVARPYREDVVLRLLELLDEGARDAPDFPRVSMT